MKTDEITTSRFTLVAIEELSRCIVVQKTGQDEQAHSRSIRMRLSVLDEEVFACIMAQACVGDRVELRIQTHWSQPGIPREVTGFQNLSRRAVDVDIHQHLVPEAEASRILVSSAEMA